MNSNSSGYSGLISDICQGIQHRLSEFFADGIATCRRFKSFADLYIGKIRKKVREAASNEDLEGLRFELECPYLLSLNDHIEVAYEEGNRCKARSSDFLVTFEGLTSLTIEVKRIREAHRGMRIDRWEKEMFERIEAIPSNLAFLLIVPEMENRADLVDRIEESNEDIIKVHLENDTNGKEQTVG